MEPCPEVATVPDEIEDWPLAEQLRIVLKIRNMDVRRGDVCEERRARLAGWIEAGREDPPD